jgi:hypothetical protein
VLLGQRNTASVFLFSGLGLFVLVLAYLIVASLTRRTAPVFEPSPVARALGSGEGVDTLTVEARDQERWQYVDLDRGFIAPPGDSSGWDLAIRRFHIRLAAPARDLGKWYRYGMLSHLLESTGEVYPVVTGGGRSGQLEVLSYYCPGLEAGCVTLRYQLEPGTSPAH